MKQKKLIFTILYFSSILLYGQSPNWQWAKSINGPGSYSNWITKITSDAVGNIYITGYFDSTTINLGGIILTNSDATGYSEDIFLAKYDSSGNVLWAKSAGGGNNDESNSITADKFGNIYITGYFYDTITFGSIILSSTCNNLMAIFIAKYDTSGNVIWAKSADCSFNAIANSITSDAFGNVYITGCFSGQIIFDSDTLTNSGGGYNIFITKYDSSGNVIWAKSTSSAGTFLFNYSNSIITDAIGNVYLKGYFDTDSISFGNITLYNSGSNYIIFIAKYDSSGNVIWAKSGTGFGTFLGTCSNLITTDTTGNIYMTGYTVSSSITFGNQTLNYTAYGGADILIAKFDTSGSIIWAKTVGGLYNDEGFGVCADITGNVYITGFFISPAINFGNTTLNNSSSQYADIFVTKYDSSGNVLWAKSAGGNYDEGGLGITADIMGNIYIAGEFSSSSITFGNSTIYNYSVGRDLFVAKLGSTITKIGNVENKSSVIVYPNPANEILNIENAEYSKIAIYNLLGEVVLKTKCNSAFSTINVSALAEGTYIVKVVSEKNIVTKKICVIK